jgi:hypothetical protein
MKVLTTIIFNHFEVFVCAFQGTMYFILDYCGTWVLHKIFYKWNLSVAREWSPFQWLMEN